MANFTGDLNALSEALQGVLDEAGRNNLTARGLIHQLDRLIERQDVALDLMRAALGMNEGQVLRAEPLGG